MSTKQTWNFVALTSIISLTASSTPAQALLAPPTCEMHVWASPYIQNDITGIFPGGALAAVETQGYRNKLKRGKSTVTQTLLTNELLMKALRESTIGQRLNIPADKFILENDPNAQQAFIKSSANEAEGCRYGFAFQIVKFEKSTVYGKQLTLFYNITDRTVRPKPRNIHWYNSEGLKNFDPTASDEQISAVLEDGLRRVIDAIVAKKLP
ncbi:hypothetical protein QH494_03585 [Sphingomonas sp. AR_OL41]|uniref:hypothetical protein n=1 Tax=Sphingomonas sp. AR_OL41 TaxID=3042729 RepID=UPI0024819393|nr:hypothetical protein [Sphingomonas sp. AR_OL41]MDH7971251.1 hypothetical protein [Sphingomonas sp. AR_OL41]